MNNRHGIGWVFPNEYISYMTLADMLWLPHSALDDHPSEMRRAITCIVLQSSTPRTQPCAITALLGVTCEAQTLVSSARTPKTVCLNLLLDLSPHREFAAQMLRCLLSKAAGSGSYLSSSSRFLVKLFTPLHSYLDTNRT